jgi:hypothetical protein
MPDWRLVMPVVVAYEILRGFERHRYDAHVISFVVAGFLVPVAADG